MVGVGAWIVPYFSLLYLHPVLEPYQMRIRPIRENCFDAADACIREYTKCTNSA